MGSSENESSGKQSKITHSLKDLFIYVRIFLGVLIGIMLCIAAYIAYGVRVSSFDGSFLLDGFGRKLVPVPVLLKIIGIGGEDGHWPGLFWAAFDFIFLGISGMLAVYIAAGRSALIKMLKSK